MAEQKVFAKGLWAKRHDKAPDFVIASLSFKTEDFAQFLKEHTNDKGYVNLQILKSKEHGKFNATLDTFVPKSQTQEAPKEEEVF